MKLFSYKNLMSLSFAGLMALSVACDKKSDSTPVAAAPAPTYGYVNGTCHDTSVNTPVAAHLCAGLAANGSYRFNGTQCVDLNGAPVSQHLCTTGGVGNYRWNGTQCTDINNQPVPQNLCALSNGINGNYRWAGSQCVDINGIPVAANLCQLGVGQGYQIINGNCVSNYGMWVEYSYCVGVTGYNPNQCNGVYVKYHGGGIFATVNCFGNSCSGQTLMEYYSNRQVVCP